ncbi:MAG: sensor domain-containing diguanylate cyclase [Candidatus Hydrogenedentes bacterium]|nr:sensor domain-containing diguanylate cyclase [Candidatus Hydrogenedentota bacterium]
MPQHADHSTGPGADFEALYRRTMQLVRQVDQLSTLREISLAVNASLELAETLPIVANVVHGALDVRRITIYEFRPKEDTLQPLIAKYGSDLITASRLEEDAVPREGSHFGDAIANHAVILVNDIPQPEVYIPLIAKGEPLGVMLLQGRLDEQPFATDDAHFYHQLGSQIAIAIHNAQLYALAVNDGLTGLYVRRYFDLRLEEEFAAAQRYERVFSLLLFDIDHFKKFNDTHGHQTGDEVLKQFAHLIKKNTRQSDICCRYGGEEMAVILPQTEMEEASMLANKLCKRIRDHVFLGVGAKELSVTTSIGVATFDDSYGAPREVVEAADKALYEAKELGRNRVELAGMG